MSRGYKGRLSPRRQSLWEKITDGRSSRRRSRQLGSTLFKMKTSRATAGFLGLFKKNKGE